MNVLVLEVPEEFRGRLVEVEIWGHGTRRWVPLRIEPGVVRVNIPVVGPGWDARIVRTLEAES